MLGAVIFDFDGVVADSEMTHFISFNKSLEPYGHQITKEDYYAKYLGLTDIDLLYELVREGVLELDDAQVADLAEQKKRIFEEMIKKNSHIIDGVPEFLQLLKDNGIAIAIGSGALLAEIESILEKASLRGFFEVIVSADQVEKGKPSPDTFLLALQRLNENRAEPILPGESLVVEDSHWGLKAARTANMHSVAVTNSYHADELKAADVIVDHLSELGIEQLHELCS